MPNQKSPTTEELLASPTTSNWLKCALLEAVNRDPVDVAVDASLLAQVLHSKRILPPTLLEMAGQCDAIMRGEGVQQDADADMDADTELLSVAGLDILKRAIADAVANAGGDEARELVRLDRMLVVPSKKTAEWRPRTLRWPERSHF